MNADRGLGLAKVRVNAATRPVQDHHLRAQRRAERVVAEHHLVFSDRHFETNDGRLSGLMKARAADLDQRAWIGGDLEHAELLGLCARPRTARR